MIRLGLRLARAGGALRIFSLMIAAALAVVILGIAWGLPGALYPMAPDPMEPGRMVAPPERGTVVGLAMVLLAPVFMLLIATGRLSSVLRDQRLVSLRLIGVSKGRTLVVAAVENLVVAATGALAGVPLLLVTARGVDRMLPVQQPLEVPITRVVVLVLGVLAVSAVLAMMSARSLQILPTRARRGGVSKPASWVRLLPVSAALICFALVYREGAPVSLTMSYVFLAGVGLSALSIATTPALLSRVSAGAMRRSRRLGLTMAGRAIEADPTSASRRVGAVGVGVFALFVAAAMLAAWEALPQMRQAIQTMEVGPTSVYVSPSYDGSEDEPVLTDADLEALAQVPRAQDVVPHYGVNLAGCSRTTTEGCIKVFVGTCEHLAVTLGDIICDHQRSSWIDFSGSEQQQWRDFPEQPDSVALPGDLESVDDGTEEYVSGPQTRTLQVDGLPITPDWQIFSTRGLHEPQVELFVPAHLLGEALPAPRSAQVVVPAGTEFIQAVQEVAHERNLYAGVLEAGDYNTLVTIRTTLAAFGAAMVAVVLLAVSLSIADWLRESRRPRMRLVAIGVPRRVIGTAYLAQFALPLIGAMILGGGLGLAGYETYRAIDDLAQEAVAGFYLSSVFWWLTLALFAGVLVASSLSLLAARDRMRPEFLRVE